MSLNKIINSKHVLLQHNPFFHKVWGRYIEASVTTDWAIFTISWQQKISQKWPKYFGDFLVYF